jgi:hypothetical protein
VYQLAAVNRDPKRKFPSISEFMPLPTDKQVDQNAEGKRLQDVMNQYKAQKKKTNGSGT